ncbi:MAG TPA: NAD(P)/FAD-dependent oxidoreductase [Solirubrobacteraceae bacterium]|nr:NAD(P)/FAD-dependent oxidoreductase [Solirubrobacteraceae bacterium]
MASSQASNEYDAVIVGASLAGCASAILLAQAGALVALVEKSPDPGAYKKICSHYIQSSAVATIERLGLMQPILDAGGLRSRARIWSRYGWVGSSPGTPWPAGVNIRREKLDPMIRELASRTPGVETFLGQSVHELIRDGGRIVGVRASDAHGSELELRCELVVGADGRGTRVAKLAGVKEKVVPHGRFAYGGYFEGPAPAGAPDASLWLLDPDMAAAFPTDDGLTFYAAMPVKERLESFRADPEQALVELVASIPEAPPIRESRLVAPVQGKLDMTNVAHTVSAPGLALVGDAALAIDPLWGVGCGWALQSAEWMADAVSPALQGSEPLERGLKRYRRRHARGLRGHAQLMYDYAGGRPFSPLEKLLFSAATRSDSMAHTFEGFGTRNIGPARMLATAVPGSLVVNARHALAGAR